MSKLYPLQDMESLPELVHVDSIVASSVGLPSMADDILCDGVDKKIDCIMEILCWLSPCYLFWCLWAYVAQSLLTDFKTLFSTMQERAVVWTCWTTWNIRRSSSQILHLTVRASALSCGSCCCSEFVAEEL